MVRRSVSPIWVWARKWRFAAVAALFLCFYGLVAYALRGLSWHLKWSGVLADAALGRGVVTFMWRDVLPEIEPLWNEATLMIDGWKCVDHGSRHLERIMQTLPEGSEKEIFRTYSSYEEEDRGHGIGSTVKCGMRTLEVSKKLSAALGNNVSIMLDDKTPCHSSYRLVSTGEGDFDALGAAGQHFGTTHHLGSISLRRADRMVNALEKTLGHTGMQYVWPNVSFRGLYWYPPGGFTEWHTDGRHVEGWRLYLTHIDVERQSFFAYWKGGQTHWVPDRHGQANLFRVVPGMPLWHAVASEGAQRFSIGIAISNELAQKILRKITLPKRN